MPKRRVYCRECGKVFPPSAISIRGLCGLCAMKRIIASHEQIVERKGPYYRKWKRNFKKGLAKRDALIRERKERSKE